MVRSNQNSEYDSLWVNIVGGILVDVELTKVTKTKRIQQLYLHAIVMLKKKRGGEKQRRGKTFPLTSLCGSNSVNNPTSRGHYFANSMQF